MFFSLPINFWAVLVSGIISFAIGSAWYTVLFGKKWQKEVGLSDEELAKGNMALIYGGSLVFMILMDLALAFVLRAVNVTNWFDGALIGLFLGAFLVASSTAINYLYQRKSISLFLIDSSYQVLFLTISGAILAVWR